VGWRCIRGWRDGCSQRHVHVIMVVISILRCIWCWMVLLIRQQVEQDGASQIVMTQDVRGTGSQRAWHEAGRDDTLEQGEHEQPSQWKPAVFMTP